MCWSVALYGSEICIKQERQAACKGICYVALEDYAEISWMDKLKNDVIFRYWRMKNLEAYKQQKKEMVKTCDEI